MINSLDELASLLDRLTNRVDQLDNRLSALEEKTQLKAAQSNGQKLQVASAPECVTVAASFHAAAAAPAHVPAHAMESTFSRPTGNVAPVVGKVFLGVAGAYVLRALAESGSLPPMLVVPVALAYAGMWLFWAARTETSVRFSVAAYAATSAIIFSPMLWELTVRFKILPDTLTALLLVTFAVFAWILARKRALIPLVWISAFAASLTSLGLLFSTRDPAPFVVALIVMAVGTEASELCNLTFNAQILIASALDVAVASVIVIYTAGQGAPAEYRPVTLGLLVVIISAPLVIYGGSTVTRSIVLRRGITVLDIAQTVIAFALAWFGIVRSTHNSTAFGVFCLAAAAGCYMAALTRFAQDADREYHVFAAFAPALLLVGISLALPNFLLAPFLALAAVSATWAGEFRKRVTLGFHGIIFLLASALLSGLLLFVARALFAGFSADLSWQVCFTALCSLVCCGTIWRMPGNERQHRLLRLMLTGISAIVVAAFFIFGLVMVIWSGVAPPSARLAVIRTLVICAVALVLGVVKSTRAKNELVWTAYGAMSFCALKLLLEDLRTGSTASIAASLFLYGLAWLLLPRIVRKSRSTALE